MKKVPDDRFSWRDISCHSFVENHILDLTNIPFEANDEQMQERDRQRAEIKNRMKKQSKYRYPLRGQDITTDDNTSSMDSIRNHVNTDLENLDTDVEDGFKERKKPNNLPLRAGNKPTDVVAGIAPSNEHVNIHAYYNNIANNMVVKRFEDNFEMTKDKANACIGPQNGAVTNTNKLGEAQDTDNALEKGSCKNKSKDLEKPKLTQNLERLSSTEINNTDETSIELRHSIDSE